MLNCQKILTADKLGFSGHFVQFCPMTLRVDIIGFLIFQWTLWTNWTLFLLELEKKYFNLYIGLKFCPICPVCPEAGDKFSCTKGWTRLDTFFWFVHRFVQFVHIREVTGRTNTGISWTGQSFHICPYM